MWTMQMQMHENGEATVGPEGCRMAVQAGKAEPVKRSIVCGRVVRRRAPSQL